MNGILADFQEMRPHGLELSNPKAFGWSLGAIVVVTLFCGVVVAVNTWRVSQYDEADLDKLLMHLHHCNNNLLMHMAVPGEKLYQMAQKQCEIIRQRFRSGTSPPTGSPEHSEEILKEESTQPDTVEADETVSVEVPSSPPEDQPQLSDSVQNQKTSVDHHSNPEHPPMENELKKSEVERIDENAESSNCEVDPVQVESSDVDSSDAEVGVAFIEDTRDVNDGAIYASKDPCPEGLRFRNLRDPNIDNEE